MIIINKQKITTTADYRQLTSDVIKKKYPYIFLGASIILIMLLLITGYLKKSQLTQIIKPIIITKQKDILTKPTVSGINYPQTYTVKDGDNLWSIAESAYGSGFNAYDLAKANNIINPNIIEIGQKINLPVLIPKNPTKGEIASAMTKQITIRETSYIIKQGDYLWKIAEEAYGDGYVWVKLAKANNLEDPNIIHVGNILNIPKE